MSAQLKKPAVLIAGLAIGLAVLFLLSRGGGSSASGGNATLQSQDMALRANVAMAAQNTEFNIAALNYMTVKAGLAAKSRSDDTSASTAIALQSLMNVDNINSTMNVQALQRNQIAGSIAVNAMQRDAYLQAASMENALKLHVADQQYDIAKTVGISYARIASDEAVALARINAQTATTVANINAAAQAQAGRAGNRNAMFNNAGGIMDAAGSFIGGFSGGGGGESDDSGIDIGTIATVAAMFI